MIKRIIVGVIVLGIAAFGVAQGVKAQTEDGRLMTLYDRGVKSVFLTHEKTIKAALEAQHIALDPRDTVEPGLDEELVAPDYHVNIYRARPVIVVDGAVRTKVMSPYQTVERIAKDANIPLYPEDATKLMPSTDYIGDGAGLELIIDRAVSFTFDLYGRKSDVRTHGDTVAEMLQEKKITLGPNDRVSVPLETPMVNGMNVRVWREGEQTISEDQPLPYSSEIIYDADRPLGYRAVQSVGTPGVQVVTYQVTIKEGVELARQEIARITTTAPTKQTQVIGIQGLSAGLTQSKGALFSTDSRGVVHRETYYDLDMGRVMYACGQGGRYSVRFDGMKIDADGYIIIAANYAKYPKCSVVETSAGPGKVYDTGGFVSRYPDGFDLATDWSNKNGR